MTFRNHRDNLSLRFHVCLLLFLGLTLNIDSQSAIRVTGTVSDPSGALSGAVIIATNEKTDITVRATSGFRGAFSIELPPGLYSFMFSADGHTGATFHHVAIPHPQGAAPIDAVLPPLPQENNPGALPLPKIKVDGSSPDNFPPSDISRASGRAFLIGKEPEEPGFGLYSYLLLSSPPSTDTERQRVLAVFKAFIDRLEDVASQQAYTRKGNLNVTYLLVLDHPQGNTPSPDWVLTHYNYPRAKVLLTLFGAAGHDVLGGPYIASSQTPFSELTSAPKPHLWQDMSAVSSSVAASWEKEFERCASRKEFWAPDTRNQAMLDLQTFIANAAEAMRTASEGAADFKKMVAAWVSWQ